MSNSKWSEIRSDFIDEDDGFLRIDAWEMDDDAEEGKVIAYVDTLSGRVIYIDPGARTDLYAQEEIEAAVTQYKAEHPYSVEDLEEICRSVVSYELEEPDLSDTVANLEAFGFTEEQMHFFGVPEDES